jgi:diguanylate cyclase (GGDEF)-like protein
MNDKVLIVDDDPSMLRLLKKYLNASGYGVLQASNGQEALRIVLAEEPRIVITDWMMPEMDGVELCRKLRQHEGVRFVYIIIVTAHSDLNRVVEAFEAGADDFLSKPVGRPELMARLRAGEHIARLESDLAKRTREMHRLNAEMAIANEKLAMANDELKRMATTDALTGLTNRREAMNKLDKLWSTGERYGHPFACITLDIDHFKKFNDMHGHATGDTVLREIAAVLRSHVRATDIVCRMGGEEFLVLCPNVGEKGAVKCAEHMRAAVEDHGFSHGGVHLKVTVSLGVAEWMQDMTGPDELLQRADDALYASKAGGRNQVTLADETLELPTA